MFLEVFWNRNRYLDLGKQFSCFDSKHILNRFLAISVLSHIYEICFFTNNRMIKKYSHPLVVRVSPRTQKLIFQIKIFRIHNCAFELPPKQSAPSGYFSFLLLL